MLLAFPVTRHLGLLCGLANLISHLIVQVLKRSLVRARPTVRQNDIAPLIRTPDPYSFPSGHSAAAAAIGLMLALDMPFIAPLAFLVVAGVGASRIYLRIHYPTDVIMGQLIGAGTSLLVRLMLA